MARYLRRADPDLGIPLIEPNPIYHTCYGSNEVLSGTRPIAGIQVGYDNLSAAGIDVVQARVTGIDPAARTLSTDAGTTLTFDPKQAAFELAWERLYGYNTPDSLIDWLPADGVVALDEAAGTVTTASGITYSGEVINLIPNQTAGAIAHAVYPTEGDCAPVDLRTFESSRHPFIHVLGDASIAGALPKSGYAANAEANANACAAAVAAQLRGQPLPSPAYANTCCSVVGEDYGISMVPQYRLTEDGSQIQAIGGGTTPLSCRKRPSPPLPSRCACGSCAGSPAAAVRIAAPGLSQRIAW